MTAVYRYDGLGRRIDKQVNGVSIKYIYDNENILMELDGTNTLKARYTFGDQIDQPLVMERDGQSYFYHTDNLGSITELTDVTGSIINAYVYDSFGNIVFQSGSIENPFTYTAREFDQESELYFYRARYYDPSIGRFMQEDPLGFQSGDSNFYTYVSNNPLAYTDPSGLIISGFGFITEGFRELFGKPEGNCICIRAFCFEPTMIVPYIVCQVQYRCFGSCGKETEFTITEVYFWPEPKKPSIINFFWNSYPGCKGYPGQTSSPLAPLGSGKGPIGPIT